MFYFIRRAFASHSETGADTAYATRLFNTSGLFFEAWISTTDNAEGDYKKKQADVKVIVAAMEKQWKNIYPDEPFNIIF